MKEVQHTYTRKEFGFKLIQIKGTRKKWLDIKKHNNSYYVGWIKEYMTLAEEHLEKNEDDFAGAHEYAINGTPHFDGSSHAFAGMIGLIRGVWFYADDLLPIWKEKWPFFEW